MQNQYEINHFKILDDILKGIDESLKKGSQSEERGYVELLTAYDIFTKLYGNNEDKKIFVINKKNNYLLKDDFKTLEKDSERNYLLFFGGDNSTPGHFISAKAKKDSTGKVTLYIADSHEPDRTFGSSYTEEGLVSQGLLKKDGEVPNLQYDNQDIDNFEVKRVHVDNQYRDTCFMHAIMNLQNIFLQGKTKNHDDAQEQIDMQNIIAFGQLMRKKQEEEESLGQEAEQEVELIEEGLEAEELKDQQSVTVRDNNPEDKTKGLSDIFKAIKNETIITFDDDINKLKFSHDDFGDTIVTKKASDDVLEYDFEISDTNNEKYAEYLLNKISELVKDGQTIELNLENLSSEKDKILKERIEELCRSDKYSSIKLKENISDEVNLENNSDLGNPNNSEMQDDTTMSEPDSPLSVHSYNNSFNRENSQSTTPPRIIELPDEEEQQDEQSSITVDVNDLTIDKLKEQINQLLKSNPEHKTVSLDGIDCSDSESLNDILKQLFLDEEFKEIDFTLNGETIQKVKRTKTNRP